MDRPTLHLMVGLPCSGKTTYARALSAAEKALLLSPDEWQIALFGDDYDHPEHNARHDTVERMLIEMAARALSIGTSAILDFGFWGKDERDSLRAMAKEMGARFRIHYLDASFDELIARVEARNRNLNGRCFTILPEQMRVWWAQIERPTAEELAAEDED